MYYDLMKTTEHIDTIISKEDNVIKYVFKETPEDSHDMIPYIFEISYINRNDGRIILCIPTQSMCNLGCKFCHCTDYIGKIKVRNIPQHSMGRACCYVLNDLNYLDSNKTFLLSFMGCGEPLTDTSYIVNLIRSINGNSHFGAKHRFAIATSLPKHLWVSLMKLATLGKDFGDIVKLHFSMHYTTDKMRQEYMPHTLDLESSFKVLDMYKHFTGGEIEIHYALMEGINDTPEDLHRLREMLKYRDFKVKLLHYNKREALDAKKSTNNTVNTFKTVLESYNIPTTYYIPPGLDIGASCGQFLLDRYVNANLKEKEV